MSGSPNSGWKQVHEKLTGRTPSDVEEPHQASETSDFSKQIDNKRIEEHRREADKLDNDYWAATKISQALSEVFKEEGEFVILQYQKDHGLVPVISVNQDKLTIESGLHYNTQYIEVEQNGESYEFNVASIAEQSNRAGHMIGKDEYVDQIDRIPNLNKYCEEDCADPFDNVSEEAIDGMFFGPGFEEAYRNKAVERIVRKTGNYDQE